MSKDAQRSFARAAAVISALLIVAGVAILIAGYLVARSRAPQEEQRIAALQKQVTADSSFAKELAAEHERITAQRLARKAAGDRIAILLITAAAAFISSSKWLVALRGRRPVAMSKLVQISAPQAPAPKPTLARPSGFASAGDEIDLLFVDEIVEKEGRSKEAAIPILQAIQSRYRYLPDEALERVCELTEITPAQIAGASSFYARFRRSPAGRHIVRVCHGTACHVSGARQITDELRRRLEIPKGEDTDPARMFTLDEVACLGCCSLAPVLMVDDRAAGRLTPASACGALDVVAEEEPA